MGDIVARATEPALAAIKLAWWRERLQELDQGKVPAEPRLQAAAQELLSRGVTGAMLAEQEDGWAAMLEPFSWGDETIERIGGRGPILFAIASRILQSETIIAGAGSAWVLANAARGCSDWPSRTHLFLHAQFLTEEIAAYRFPAALRPLSMFAALARRDVRRGEFNIEPEATPGRALTLLRHRLTGRLH